MRRVVHSAVADRRYRGNGTRPRGGSCCGCLRLPDRAAQALAERVFAPLRVELGLLSAVIDTPLQREMSLILQRNDALPRGRPL